MNKQGLSTSQYQQYPQAYSVPAQTPPQNEKQSAVNVYINAGQHPYAGQPNFYPYYYPYPYYIPQYVPQQPQQQNTAPLASQNINQANPVNNQNKEEPEKNLTPLTPELLQGLQADLTKGEKQDRYRAIARVINLMNEDREQRKDGALVDLIKIGQHSNQPHAVREAANAAATSIKYDTPKRKGFEVLVDNDLE